MRILSKFQSIKNLLDDDYTLYENGEVLREYDANNYPGGQNLKQTLKANELKFEIKEKLLENASDDDKEVVKNLLEI